MRQLFIYLFMILTVFVLHTYQPSSLTHFIVTVWLTLGLNPILSFAFCKDSSPPQIVQDLTHDISHMTFSHCVCC